MSIKARKHLSLPIDVLEDMLTSGIDISNWATDAWLKDKYTTDLLEKEIKITKERLIELENRLKDNIEFLEKINKLTNPREIKLLGALNSKLNAITDDFVAQEELFKEWKKIYYNYFKVRLTTNMIKKKVRLYQEQIK